MLKLTGFVLPDVGILTLTAMAGKTDPATVTLDDLDDAADKLEELYTNSIGKKLLKRLFPNSGWDQPSWDKPQFVYKRKAWADLVLRGHREDALKSALEALGSKEISEMVLRDKSPVPLCAFTGKPAYLRVRRTMIPMLNSHSAINFSAMGEAGLPVSAEILLAIHAMPLGSISTKGNMLAVESNSTALMMSFVKKHFDDNQLFVSLARQSEYDGYVNFSSYKSYLVKQLVDKQRAAEQGMDFDDFSIPSVTAYYFTNDNRGGEMDIHYLPSNIIQFIYEASKDEHAASWGNIVNRAWVEDKPESEELKSKTPKLTQRNLIYEDLFDLPENARAFLRTYFLRMPLKRFKDDPRGNHSPFTDVNLISWNLTALFLKGIMGMQKNRIDQIRALGDRLAAHIQSQGDRRLLKDLYYERQYWRFRGALLRTMHGYSGDEPLVTFDGYVQIFSPFEEGEGMERADWNLARDLLLIRIFEKLHQNGYWSAVEEALADENQDEALKPVTD